VVNGAIHLIANYDLFVNRPSCCVINQQLQCFSTCATGRTSADEKTVRCGWQARCGRENPVVLL